MWDITGCIGMEPELLREEVQNESLDELLDNIGTYEKEIVPVFSLDKKVYSILGVIIVVLGLIIYSSLPPGTIAFVDKMKDSDNDGLNDFDELRMGLDPKNNDTDGDGINDSVDICPNSLTGVTIDTNYDGCFDAESDDDDGDGIIDSLDSCQIGVSNWLSSTELDFDSDGCHDEAEDIDDDNDDVSDSEDDCRLTPINSTDFDADGCADFEDNDIDNDGFSNPQDLCNFTQGQISLLESGSDYDQDGCNDADEDTDIDGDGVLNSDDFCNFSVLGWTSNASSDNDSDGCNDETEDDDDDGDGYPDASDPCPNGNYSAPDYDEDGCEDSIDLDDDGDGINDENDTCPQGEKNWSSWGWFSYDLDGDGCKSDVEDDDNDNDGIHNSADGCKNGQVGWTSNSSTDIDSDGCKDDQEDNDDDGDGVLDYFDAFPLDSSESSDNDMDGIGDSSDLDDDNDGCDDEFDINREIDIGMRLNIDRFLFTDQIDQGNVVGEIFFVVNVGEKSVGYFEETDIVLNQERVLSHSLVFDLDDSENYGCGANDFKRYHWIGIEAWDHDPTDSDQLDINPSPFHRTMMFIYDAERNQVTDFENYTSPRGVSDGSTDTSNTDADDDDGKIWFSWERVNIANLNQPNWEWDYGGYSHQIQRNLDYEEYVDARKLDHVRNYTNQEDHLKFVTPESSDIQTLASELSNLSEQFNYDSEQKANFILAFVKSIDEMYNNEADGYGNDPKYPIEMLWEGTGNSENSVYLYNSIMEATGFDTVIIQSNVKTLSNDGNLGLYFFSGIALSNGSGEFVNLNGTNKDEIPFFHAHSSGGSAGIGQTRWYEITIIQVCD